MTSATDTMTDIESARLAVRRAANRTKSRREAKDAAWKKVCAADCARGWRGRESRHALFLALAHAVAYAHYAARTAEYAEALKAEAWAKAAYWEARKISQFISQTGGDRHE